jgi:farnesyl-diphosphate farnesyltransferase
VKRSSTSTATKRNVVRPVSRVSPGLAPSEDDYAFCATLLPKVSRTFALSITVLPESLREAVRVSYLLCRAVDTIEDDAVIKGATREQLFDLFDALMSDDGTDPGDFERMTAELDLGAGTDDQTLCLSAGAVFRCFRALPIGQRAVIRPHVLEMSRGMREYTDRADRIGRLRLRDMDELERYCYFVAGTVGKLLTGLFEEHIGELPRQAATALRARAISFGLALQMVNIVKDVAADHVRGDCFLPEEVASGAGVPLDRILDPEHRPAGLEVVRAVCRRAREHLRRAEEYTLVWPADRGRDVRLFCTVPLALALATLHEVERGSDTLVPGKTPKVSRQAVMKIFADADFAIRRDDTLRWMLAYYASGAYLDDQAGSRPAAPPAPERAQPFSSEGPTSGVVRLAPLSGTQEQKR